MHGTVCDFQAMERLVGTLHPQQDYYGRQCSNLLHSYCTGTYTEVTLLLLWGNSAVTMEYPHSYSVGVPAWVLEGSTGATSKKQHCYFSVDTSAVTVQLGTASPVIVILLCRHKHRHRHTGMRHLHYIQILNFNWIFF